MNPTLHVRSSIGSASLLAQIVVYVCRVGGAGSEAPEPAGQDANNDARAQHGVWRRSCGRAQDDSRRLQEAGCCGLTRPLIVIKTGEAEF